MKNNLFATISSGKYKGKRLNLPSLATTRSTKSIVKESVFNSLQNDIYNSVFIELFGGSGLMAATAVSNYAKKGYAIELDKLAFNSLKSNYDKIGDSDLIALYGDTFKLTPKIVDGNITQKIILYVDPPFDIRDGFDGIYDRIYELLAKLKVDIVVIEHISSHNALDKIGELALYKSRKFGNTSLSYYTKCIS
ncbi:16S rRNA (guanine(966)-N(2))-methyltransferase RsmD [Campylobacter sp. CX2-8023-23]|uniref:16S rRNA (Guanine(966)-N(2))-methyltransferase RsmD n=1 Tax=Campylobacter porcelli TaxID=1660073 RepID=A0ABU7M620_9BACT|nr:16S rRNA (guanine(966)-N(2))-methyltransferase RsmD [Campylobacter sp. CX2-8023-23]MEE3745155.1 16S rRNA (guanine(966)-N(2))-methyltransferase RsmD [Campylobacter sp. CX2-4855-23]MEE3777380.1 16S rRNA (guanine(966)-N(2))-methyltransferase RsmD [Campylobacter sp. CX2-4080-23]